MQILWDSMDFVSKGANHLPTIILWVTKCLLYIKAK